MAVYSGCFERFDCILISLFLRCWNLFDFFISKKLAFVSGIDIFVLDMFNLISLGVVCLGAASHILKSKIEKTAAAVVAGVVGIGLLLAPSVVGQERPPDEPRPSDSPTLLSPYVNSIEVHNHASSGFSISLDVSGWEAFGGAYLCDVEDRCLHWSPLSSRRFRWPAPVYLANPPEGTSTHSYSFTLKPRLSEGLAEYRPFSSAGLEIDVTVYIEVTDGYVSAIYCYVDYPTVYLGPFRRSDYYPPLIYFGTWYDKGFWYSG